jgi:hypothetical protein
METRAGNRSRRGNSAREERGESAAVPQQSTATLSSQPSEVEDRQQQQRVEEEERTLRRQLDLLQQARRVASLRQQVATLQAGGDNELPEEPQDPIEEMKGLERTIDDASSATSLNRRRGDDEEPEQQGEKRQRTHIKLPDPRKYSATSYREYVQYVRICKQHFSANPREMNEDTARALCVRVWSEGETQDAIYRMLEEARPRVPPWDELKRFLRDLLTPEHQHS